MAINFTFDPNQYEAKDFEIIPEGDYRVRISDVVEKTFNSGNEGFEITLDVNGKSSRLWLYLVINANDPKQTNQRIGAFFDSFGITNVNLAAYKTWIGKVGAVRVKHEDYNGSKSAKVAYCIARNKQDKLPAWTGNNEQPVATTSFDGGYTIIEDGDLPF